MQSLFALLAQLFTKAWVVLVITVMGSGAVAVYYFSSADPKSTSHTGSQPIIVQTSPVTNGGHGNPMPVVPEANAGLVLVPVVAAMLLLSSRRLLSAKTGTTSADPEVAASPGGVTG
jgi:hypothetical protein